MDIIKLKPAVKDYIWGGVKMKTVWGKQSDLEKIAECWELSCHPDGMSVIQNGEFKGKTFPEYLEKHGKNALGTNCEKFEDFPVLIKLLDAQDNLSIQVHPDDEYALENEKQYGKTEMWYIADCEPDAFIYYGFSKNITSDEYKNRIQNNTLTDVLNKVYVKKGDSFFIKAGTIHAIGAGCTIAEIQQSSNVTYRVYDYGRLGVDGKPRDLHVKQALEVTSLTAVNATENTGNRIAECKYFAVDKYDINGSESFICDEKSFNSVLCIDGNGKITSGNNILEIRKSDSIFIPAKTGEYNIEGDCVVLLTSIPCQKYRVGVDLGGTNIAVGIVDEDYKIVAKYSTPTLSERPYQEVVADIAKAVNIALEQENISVEQCVSIGIGSPGTCNCETGVVTYANNLGWENVPLVAELNKHLNIPCIIGNDANCAALGEALAGAAKGCKNVIMLTLGTGVGGGIIIDGKIYAGEYSAGAELGHVVIKFDGIQCNCGLKGCLEVYTSATALIGQTRDAANANKDSLLNKVITDEGKINGKTVFTAANMGDETAQKVIDEYLNYLGVGIVNYINIFRPEVVIIGGGISNEGDKIIKPLNVLAKNCYGGEKTPVPRVVKAKLGGDAGIIGAAYA